MNVEEVHFVTRGAVTAVDFLLDSSWWLRPREWMWKDEENDVLHQSAVTRSVACLSPWACFRHLVK